MEGVNIMGGEVIFTSNPNKGHAGNRKTKL